jgi:hypothetical protein
MTTANKVGLVIFLMGLIDFPVPDSRGLAFAVVNFVMVYGGAAMFIWETRKATK